MQTKPILTITTLAVAMALAAAFGGYYLGRTKAQEQVSDQAYKLAAEADPFWQFGGRPASTDDSQTLKLRAGVGDIRAALILSDRDLIQAAKASKAGHHGHEANLLLEAFQTQAEAYSSVYQGILHLSFQHPKPWPIF
ncbi:hypothetical protein THIX_60450 [Thiomonas sp. X19]|uniref:hypothetical protein n=1 Tax=Thiomonas sp. X19 TaxID=1050370 RepID=UPI000B73558C|nr:hypothetical protein [Thiomonas sp. X19]SCC94392.1 hypothetical protein THIX_60450 [Thiomonas sp. X19]